MKAWVVDGGFGLSHLSMIERPMPVAKSGEVVVKVRAVSLNFRDLLMVKGLYNPRQPLPLVPVSDGVGEIIAIGDGVTSVKIGERVASTFFQDWQSGEPTKHKLRSTLGGPIDGMLAEYVVLSEHGVVPVPQHLTDTEAATLPCAALTAWNALAENGRAKSGDTVVLLGTGGVSMFALQFAQQMGMNIVVVSGSDEKLALAKNLGACHLINRVQTPHWSKIIKEITSDVGADHVVELGGASTFAESIASLRPGGLVSVIGIVGGDQVTCQLTSILMNNIRIQGLMVGHREMFLAMNKAITVHRTKPVIDRVFAFNEAKQAFSYLEAGQHIGKICLSF